MSKYISRPYCVTDGCPNRRSAASGLCKYCHSYFLEVGKYPKYDDIPRNPHRGLLMPWATMAADADTNDCLGWPFTVNSAGYGLVSYRGSARPVTQVVWEIRNGEPWPKGDGSRGGGLVTRHSCRNTECVNWRHFSPGTQTENMRDRDRDGTRNNGERNGRSALTQAQVDVIRERIEAGELSSVIASDYSVSWSTINRIRKGETWK